MLKYLSIVLFAASVTGFIWLLYTEIATWWGRRIHRYASWVADEFDAMFEDMSIARATRLITIVILSSFLLGYLTGGLVPALLFAGAGYFVPRVFVTYQRRRRLEAIDDQLIDALRLMANAIKAGLTLQQALELGAREMKPPIADELGRVIKEIELGRLMDEALRRFAERVPLADVRLMTDSILILRETGGNLSETFEVIANTVVERKKVQGKIKSITAQGMTQGVIVCLMPIALMLLFSIVDQNYMRPFFTTPLGWMMLLVVLVLDGVGLFLMFKLVKVNV
ncbi:MAG TPA: type II secretion system F family protein [Vicinamibacterales bacterium]|jgi:tight adherence protein B|nr:type II secretion system F family protein [Vicinamibacterales bacterium]